MISCLKELTPEGMTALRAAVIARDVSRIKAIADDPKLAQISPLGHYMLDTSKTFKSSYDLGEYLHSTVFFDVKQPSEVYQASGVWAWISAPAAPNSAFPPVWSAW